MQTWRWEVHLDLACMMNMAEAEGVRGAGGSVTSMYEQRLAQLQKYHTTKGIRRPSLVYLDWGMMSSRFRSVGPANPHGQVLLVRIGRF